MQRAPDGEICARHHARLNHHASCARACTCARVTVLQLDDDLLPDERLEEGVEKLRAHIQRGPSCAARHASRRAVRRAHHRRCPPRSAPSRARSPRGIPARRACVRELAKLCAARPNWGQKTPKSAHRPARQRCTRVGHRAHPRLQMRAWSDERSVGSSIGSQQTVSDVGEGSTSGHLVSPQPRRRTSRARSHGLLSWCAP